MRPAERSFSVTSEASRFAAAENISSVIRVAPLTSAPSPTPGKMYELLHCPGTNTCPRYETAGNGLPLAKIARPSVQAYACSAVHSDCEVGLESAKTIGRGRWVAKVLSTSRVKVPP